MGFKFWTFASIAVAGLVMLIAGRVLADHYEHRPHIPPPPPGFFPESLLNEVVYLSPDKTTFHRIDCQHRSGNETQVLRRNVPEGAEPCVACMGNPPLPQVEAPWLQLGATAGTWGGVLTMIVGTSGAVASLFSRPPKASFAPGFEVRRPSE